MQSHANWSVSLGRWGGVHVRLHMFFLLFAAFTLYLGWSSVRAGTPLGSPGASLFSIAVASLAILLTSALLHELGHTYAALRLGGDSDEIVIMPWGGLVPPRAPPDPLSEVAIHLAGPAVNLAICVLCGIALLFLQGSPLWDLINPLAPSGLAEGSHWAVIGLKLLFWINWCLLLLNLLPAFPFDGGRALRAGLLLARPPGNARRAAMIVAALAKVTAVALLVLAILLRKGAENDLVPIWFSLVLLAILLWFGAKQEELRSQEPEPEEGFLGYDFSQGYTSLERSTERHVEHRGSITRWLARRRRVRRQRRRKLEAEEERRVDDILIRLHEHGIESLSEQDRSLLKRVSARYRQRESDQP